MVCCCSIIFYFLGPLERGGTDSAKEKLYALEVRGEDREKGRVWGRGGEGEGGQKGRGWRL